jgi:hypothetical protein
VYVIIPLISSSFYMECMQNGSYFSYGERMFMVVLERMLASSARNSVLTNCNLQKTIE